MEYRRLGQSGLMVSPLTLGTMTFGGDGVFAAAGDTGVDEARELIAQSRDAGVNFFDTADVYSNGESERILGARKRYRRRPDRDEGRHEGRRWS